ncbi:hypothetical protein E2C01_005928 [Portunus trituberculatus]|uniref:Uncharacterized protein n=1 Tax=Portunus trituberculatus TaxID=210409 RepID=A0A5B7CVQ9_PORTR|nr:hypothetical protein [Portunus trituberculatus]
MVKMCPSIEEVKIVKNSPSTSPLYLLVAW